MRNYRNKAKTIINAGSGAAALQSVDRFQHQVRKLVEIIYQVIFSFKSEVLRMLPVGLDDFTLYGTCAAVFLLLGLNLNCMEEDNCGKCSTQLSIMFSKC